MNYRRANADELVLDDRNRYHKLCEELDYVMSLNSKYVEVLIGDEYKNIHSAGNALRRAIGTSGNYPISVHECNNKLILERTDI